MATRDNNRSRTCSRRLAQSTSPQESTLLGSPNGRVSDICKPSRSQRSQTCCWRSGSSRGSARSSRRNTISSREAQGSTPSAPGRCDRARRCSSTRPRSAGCGGFCSPPKACHRPRGSPRLRTERPIDPRGRPRLACAAGPWEGTPMKRRSIAAVVAALVLLLVVVLANRQSLPPRAAGPTESAATEEPAAEEPGAEEPDAEEQGKGGNPEAAEQAETTDKRLAAVAAAKANGTLGVDASALQGAPAQGWAGEYVVDRKADDWEPAVATDPNDPWV